MKPMIYEKSEVLDKPFVVVSGLPGSGKSSVARRLADMLNLRLIDKDDILEHLFELKGVGDEAWRRQLSRESDLIFQNEARASDGAILVSFWHLTGMPADSGTPTNWLSKLSNRLVNLHCVCPPEVAAARFLRRERHPGHLDSKSSEEEVLAGLRQIVNLPPLEIRHRVHVDSSLDPDLDSVVGKYPNGLDAPRICDVNELESQRSLP